MSKMKKMAAGPAVFMAALLILFTAGIAGAAQSPVAPAFSGTGMDGKTVSSGQLAGKAYIVNFFASWCPPCRAEIPDMVELQKKYGVKGFTFIGAAVNENEVSIKKFMKANGITYPVILADQKIVSAYSRYVPGGLRSIPTTFVVDRSGKITRVFSGVRSKADFEKMILDALKPVKAVK